MIKKLKYILIGLGIIGVCYLGGDVTKNEVSAEKLNTKYNASQEIKAKYSLEGTSLVKQDIKNAELDKYANEQKDEVKITIGDSEPVLKGGLLSGSTTTEFKPNIELKRWNEVSFKIKTDKLLEGVATKDKDLKFDKDKIRFDTPKISFEMYDYAEGEGGYKFVWYLNEKPTTNKVEFQIESSGLDFFYQPPLTQEYQNGYSEEFQKEIVVSETQVKDLDGNVLVECPENVVGSYAVYHQTKGGMNDINGKEYKVGKAFHIYRPHITDAEGKETWGILHIENGIYSVEIPQEFLDKAVYPIKSNDNYGYTSSGAKSFNSTSYPQGQQEGNFPVGGGSITSMSSYTGAAGSPALKSTNVSYTATGGTNYGLAIWVKATVFYVSHAIYTISSGKLGTKLASDSSQSDSSGGRNIFYDDSTDWGMITYKTGQTFPTWPTTFSGSDYTDDFRISVYATYTPTGGGAAEPEPQIIIISELNFKLPIC